MNEIDYFSTFLQKTKTHLSIFPKWAQKISAPFNDFYIDKYDETFENPIPFWLL